MAYKIFDEVGLFKSFDIPINPFIQFFTRLESGYNDLPCNFFLISIFQFVDILNVFFF